ncbi:MAG: DUF6048 family protein [Prevotella sp.]|nr:DUF6048 family protein [Prevotella sp.]
MARKRTSTYTLLLAISLFLLLPATAQAQRRKPARQVQEDSIPLFRGIAVGTDLVGPAMRALADYGQYEAIVRLNLKDRYYPIIEAGVGQADKTDDGTGTRFRTSAPYARVGVDFNVLKDKHDIYRFLVGGRIGYTAYKYDLASPGVTDPVWGGQAAYGAEDVSCNQLWAELAAGVDAKIWGPVRLGWSVRYKARLHQKAGRNGEAWYVPGYGRGGSSRLSATFNLLLEF